MRRFWKIAGIATVVAIVAVAALGAVALAQDAEDEGAFPFNFRERFQDAVAGILGIDVERFESALEQAQEQVIGDAVSEGWLTEDQAERMRERAGADPGFGMRGGWMPGIMGKRGHRPGLMGGPGTSVIDVAADKLGLTVAELREKLGEDVTVADVAAEAGITVQEIVDEYVAQVTESLNEAVAEGNITQNQADWMAQQAAERAEQQLTSNLGDCAPGHFRGGGRPGRMRGFPGQGEDTGTSS
jgi:hypothetical protein